jgi:hypothetical protein
MHDGRFSTLEEVVERYSSGLSRSPTLDPNLARHPGGLHLSREGQQALVAFLKTLTDPRFRSGVPSHPFRFLRARTGGSDGQPFKASRHPRRLSGDRWKLRSQS